MINTTINVYRATRNRHIRYTQPLGASVSSNFVSSTRDRDTCTQTCENNIK